MNDIIDAKTVDSLHAEKQNRSISSGAISIKEGWIFCGILSVVSIAFASFASLSSIGQEAAGFELNFMHWTILNLILMAGYAFGMQRILLIKNIICGLLAISPLIGASLLTLTIKQQQFGLGSDITNKLYQLAAIGFPLQVSREILKDIEDVEVDRGQKQTLPLLIGDTNSKRIAYGLVYIINGALLFSPYYWNMFASEPPLYALSMAIGTPMCIIASLLSLSKGQRLLKKSIYVLLAGMISSLLLQS